MHKSLNTWIRGQVRKSVICRSASSPRRAVEIPAPHPRAPHSVSGAGGSSGFAFFEQRCVTIIEILQLHSRNLLADEPFDCHHVPSILGHHDGKGVSGGLCPSGTANP